MMISWPRLLESPAKPQWLKVDFDRIKQQDFDTTSEDSEMEELNNRTNRLPRMYKDRNFGRGRKNRGNGSNFFFRFSNFTIMNFSSRLQNGVFISVQFIPIRGLHLHIRYILHSLL
mgnify:FL=1